MSAALQAFNLPQQQAGGWWARARIAADLIAEVLPPTGALADIGCGDRKLQAVLAERGVAVAYAGFDLLPQSPEVAPFDLRQDTLPRSFDAAALLGVTEYLPDIGDVLRRLAPQCGALVVSHVLASERSPSPARLAELGWISHLHREPFLAAVRRGGFAIERERMTPDGRTLLVAARRG